MKTSLPKLSFVIPVHNRAHIIGDALQSLIGQTESDWEAIVVNDRSTDVLEAVITRLNDPRIVCVNLPVRYGSGVASARNYGNVMARGELIAVLDSDDVAAPERAQITLDSYAEHGWDVFSAGRTTLDMTTGETKHPKINPSHWDAELFKQASFVTHSSMAYTKRIAMDFPYNSSLPLEDYDFISRLIEYGLMIHHDPRVVVTWRRFETHVTGSMPPEVRSGYLKAIQHWRGWSKEAIDIRQIEP